jgi:condensin complex subunit 2
VSPSGKTPGGVAFVNNDVEELRQRRIEAHLRGVMSPSGRPAAFESARGGVSVLSNAQIAEHYADCIKLSTENKINARNAFGLHLIDYMLQMLMQYGELENFQVAGCTLDAGAKIYASRVDSMYSEAYKILGGILVNETNDKDQPENPVHHMKEQSRKESYGTTLERNIKALNMSTKGITFGLESFMSEKVREDSLMLWQLLTRDDYSLVLDTFCSSTDAEPWCGNALGACCDSLLKVFMDLATDVEICSTLSEFEINESQSMENVGSGEIPIDCGDLDYETSQPGMWVQILCYFVVCCSVLVVLEVSISLRVQILCKM